MPAVQERPRVKIVSVPPGGAPDWVRRAWVGLELPLSPEHQNEGGPERHLGQDIKGGAPFATTSYVVRSKEGIDILNAKNGSAADWWKVNMPRFYREGVNFLFDAVACELVQ